MKESIKVLSLTNNKNASLTSSSVENLVDTSILIVDANENILENNSKSLLGASCCKQVAKKVELSNENNNSNCFAINEIAERIEEFYSKSSFNKSKLNKIVESAIHWSLVNGNKQMRAFFVVKNLIIKTLK